MIDQLQQEYLNWAKKKYQFNDFSDFIEITTPFLDLNNDYISLFISESNKTYTITDDGYVINELITLGIDITKKGKRNDYFKATLNIFGVKFDHSTNELLVNFNNINLFPEMQHRLLQCVIRVSDMFVTSRNKVMSFFTEDLKSFFLESDVFFNDSTPYIGKSGNSNVFDFVLPRSKRTQPKLIKAINQPKKQAYKEPLLSFLDVSETKTDHKFIVIANDTNQKVSDEFKKPFVNYNIDVLAWSERAQWVEHLKTS